MQKTVNPVSRKNSKPLKTKEQMMDKQIMTALFQYMKARANFENVGWKLKKKDLFEWFQGGARTFFGVTVDDDGDLIEDDEYPCFFCGYVSGMLNSTVSERV